MSRHQITIKGSNVQRCGFRNIAATMARKLELKGTATYLDQDLLLEVEGNPHMILLFTNWCRTGPRDCRIEQIEITQLPLVHYATFEIIHGVVWSAKHGVRQ